MSFCNSLKAKLRQAMRDFDDYVSEHVDTALAITTGIKSFLQSSAGDILTAIIPGTLDDLVKAKLITVLGTAVDALSIVKQCSAETDINKKLHCFITAIQTVDPKLQDAMLFKLASLLTAGLDDNKLADSLYDLYVQTKFVAQKK